MTLAWARSGSVRAALALLVLDLLLRLVLGGPYPGATALLLGACGTTLLPLLPSELARPALRVAVFPALALGSFALVVTTESTLGVPLTEVSIRVAVALFVSAGVGLQAAAVSPTVVVPDSRHEAAAVAAVLALAVFCFASSWDVVGPFPPRGTDWGHYLLYADQVERQKALLIQDPFSAQDGQLFADAPMVGALYGGTLLLDGVSSRTLGPGVAGASALSMMSVLAAAGGLWGLGAALGAGALYSVAPIRLDPMYWHGLGTTLALVFVPILVLTLGLLFRGRRDARTVGLLALTLVSVAAAHTTTSVVVVMTLVASLLLDIGRAAVRRPEGDEGRLRWWWRHGAGVPIVAASAVAAVVGFGVAVHVLRQARNLGGPLDYHVFEPDWLTWGALDEYLSTEFLMVGGVSLVVVLLWRRTLLDPALLAVAALLLASVAVSQLWRLEIAYEYRRAVYPFGLGLALLVGAAVARVARWRVVLPLGIVVCAFFAHQSVGLRLPERLLSERVPTSTAPAALDSVRARIERGELPDTRLVVTDRCLHFIVPYLLNRASIAAFEPWQVGFESRLPMARKAATILAGGPKGRQVAKELAVGYIVADPHCTPDPAPGLDKTVVARDDDVVVIRLTA